MFQPEQMIEAHVNQPGFQYNNLQTPPPRNLAVGGHADSIFGLPPQ